VKGIYKEVIVSGSLHDVWNAWTTNEGVRTFFAPDSDIELSIGGKFEILFNSKEHEGVRGSETCKVLSYLPEKMLSFSWNAPPEFPNVRNGEKSWVVVEFTSLSDTKTKVLISHIGWREGEEWEQVYQYFYRAWKSVCYWLWWRFEHGTLDWTNGFEDVPRPTDDWFDFREWGGNP
jgi:uncharacterized protein YndB with AHSA1/START domain